MSGPDRRPALESILAAEARRLAAMTAGDVAALDALLAEDCLYVHSTGATDTKTTYLEQFATGAIKYLSLSVDDLRPMDLNGVVLLPHRLTGQALVGGTSRSLRSRIVAIWQIIDGTPRMRYLQSTNLPEPP
ncbi:nuclear transport factor 2 family protein [Thermopolyspora sp. NPDC052614]|uniref:nuclear transport factor 2 family protein n=1 Tax=Thermopolyspora sp. NPDC052614 TaxID=3155682 RepID=UPI003440E69B